MEIVVAEDTVAATQFADRTPTEEQQLVLNYFQNARGQFTARNAVVIARAGTGKSWTIFRGIERAPDRHILVVAFNKSIVAHAKERVSNPLVRVQTLNSLGYEFVRLAWPQTKVNRWRGRDLARQACEAKWHKDDEVIGKIDALAKFGKGCVPYAQRYEALLPIADTYLDLWMLRARGLDSDWVARRAFTAMQLATQPTGEVDFADQVFLPVRMGWCRRWFDLVCVDEAQDLNPAQLHMIQQINRSPSRIIIVGDNRQSIYRFRGADFRAMSRMQTQLGAISYKLTQSFRCGSSIVERAQAYVADIVAHPSAGVGRVRYCTPTQMLEAVAPGDFILSRTNAPLAAMCRTLLLSGQRAYIRGKDVLAPLLALFRRLRKGRGHTVEGFLTKLEKWHERERVHAQTLDFQEQRADRLTYINDLAALARIGCEGMSTVDGAIAQVQQLFAAGADDRHAIQLSTVHKAKGLEAPRVFLLWTTFDQNGRWSLEEDNIRYVAITRAKSELVYVKETNIEDHQYQTA